MNTLPEAYIAQMKRLLGEAGFFAYEQALAQPVTRALRVNLLLRPDGSLPCEIEGVGERVPWAKGCYFVDGDARPGLSPLHEGGLFYLQEPSALSAVSVLNPRPGERVLDLCAAPGGAFRCAGAALSRRKMLTIAQFLLQQRFLICYNEYIIMLLPPNRKGGKVGAHD